MMSVVRRILVAAGLTAAVASAVLADSLPAPARRAWWAAVRAQLQRCAWPRR
jgi:hypothetical protein